MHVEQWIVVVSLSGAVLFGLAAVLVPVRRLHLALSAGFLFLLAWYEIRMDRWENTVTAPIRLDIFAEIPLMIICLIFGMWQILLSRKRKKL
jgi:hypothetical protein